MEDYRTIWEAYDKLGAAVHGHGPLDEKTREYALTEYSPNRHAYGV